MACRICGEDGWPLYTCNECGNTYCSNHRLPEAHHCEALAHGGRERDGPEPDADEPEAPRFDPDKAPGGRDPSFESSPPVETRQAEDTDAASDSRRSPRELVSAAASTIVSGLLLPVRALQAVGSGVLRLGRGVRAAVLAPGVHGYLGLVVVVAAAVGGWAVVAPQSFTRTTGIDPGSVDVGAAMDKLDPSMNETAVERKIHRRINEVRRDHGLAPLSYRPALHRVADKHSQDMARNRYFSHREPDGDTFEDRYRQAGVSCPAGGENIYRLQYEGMTFTETELAKKAVTAWMKSPGHRKNILTPGFTAEGIGVEIVEQNGRTVVYITQNFCGR